ncbi:hypothetical protein [Bacillus sp. PK3_68]|uniref:hypothetical protein n=1 Tax=Bacillus sp. PK3_68 TaxID=2027408 RepID=UPI000E70B0FA|nr:hypothetical protein [Bacillus sp. PK3_68]RJS62211.1 hypothetical protein CJ483_20890 [Bacillus sp. PK3_68]
MATLFIFISFILNAVALLAIILLFTRQNRLYEVKRQQEKLVADMEEMMTAYLLEMKEENERFIKEFSSHPTAEDTFSIRTPSPPKAASEQTSADNIQADSLTISAPSMQRVRAAQVYNVTNKTPNEDGKEQIKENIALPDEQKASEDIFSLNEQGLSIGEIAKKLNKGKTEVELALKFAKTGKNS